MQKPRKRIIDIADDIEIDLDIDPALVEFIILKARQFDVKVAPSTPDDGSNATDDAEHAVLEDHASDLTETELQDAIEGLSDDAAADLIAIFWVGRDEFQAATWAEARALAAERGRADLAPYLMGDPNLGDFLEEGLTALGYHPQDFGPAA